MKLHTLLRSALLLFSLSWFSAVSAQDEETQENSPIPLPAPTEAVVADTLEAAKPQLTAGDINAWLDGLMPYAMERTDIVGAVVTVVKDGEIIANRGFGYADLENNTPVDAETTLFRPGSISKLFTWTAVMQLVEQGRIDLDENVNSYIDFEIPMERGTVTVRHLMTHTPGFQTVLKDLFTKDRGVTDEDLGKFLKTHIPPQIYDAGEVPAYTNYSTSLAGYIVERISGKPFNTYVEDHIFAPLGMTASSFRQPLPEPLAEKMSKGYATKKAGSAFAFEEVVPFPAGSLSSTGTDMAKFMISHLDQARGLMAPETADSMHNTEHDRFPGVNGFALGYYRLDKNGLPVIAHGGDTAWFHSNLFLLTSENVGLYMSVNSAGERAGHLRGSLYRAFMDRYYPADKEPLVAQPTMQEHGAELVGTYESSRAAQYNAYAFGRFASQIKITQDDQGRLLVPFITEPNGKLEPLTEVAPYAWQSESGQQFGARIKDGEIVAVARDPALVSFSPVPWHRNSAWLMPALMGAGVIFVLTFLAWPVKAFARNRLKARFTYTGEAKLAYRLAPIAALLCILYLAGWGIYFSYVMSSIYNLAADKSETPLMFLYVTAILPFLAAYLAGKTMMIRFRTAGITWFSKLSALLLLLSTLVLLWTAAGNGLLSFSTTY